MNKYFEPKIVNISLSISLNICFGMLKRTVSLRRFFLVPTTYVLVEKLDFLKILFMYSYRSKGLLDIKHKQISASAWDFQQCDMCDQQSLSSAWAYAQSEAEHLASQLEYFVSVKLLTEHKLQFLNKLKRRLHRLVMSLIL